MLTHFKRSISIALSIGMLLFNSCTKNNEVTPEDNEKKTEEVIPPGKKEKTNEEIAFEKSMLGLWQIIPSYDLSVYPRNKSMSSSQENNFKSRTVEKTSVTSIAIPSNYFFMEFLEDRTYLISDYKMSIFAGKFNAVNDTTLQLENFGTVIKTKEGKLEIKQSSTGEFINYYYKFQYNNVRINDAHVNLCSNTWVLGEDIDGKALLNEHVSDKILINFSVYGSYREKRYKNNEIINFIIKEWRYNINKNMSIFWPTIESNKEIIIIELTKDILRIQENEMINDEIIKIRNLVFRPEK
ncbi:MAG: hypothetical protein WC623_11300 [Pedobacter sp.]|uniref:hypothetical protein n=1 Tax=Pedobacter sp. TaxID=1411316 RepID=UPI003561AF41